MNWFKKLKRWQKGGLIGLTVGVVLGPFAYYLGEFLPYPSHAHALSVLVTLTHFVFYVIMLIINPIPYSMEPFNLHYYGYEPYVFMGAVLVFYGVLGTIMGLIQQIAKPFIRWPLTGLLILFLLLFYTLSVLVVTMGFVGLGFP